ncbi:MAG TPA: SprT family zinc-dependent metalloprotease [Candidatus Bathyarchaeia archaeon]|nr:SprT family zinc-dependent metalloprotease [Candidatus Bathyarchaeia archaeon]
MPTITDEEFGEITVRRSVRARSIRITVAPDGMLRASMPQYAPMIVLRRMIKTSRNKLRKMLEQQTPTYALQHGMEIGKSHKLIVGKAIRTSVRHTGQSIAVALAPGASLTDPTVERMVRDAITTALRVEAKNYLPRRLSFMAEKLGCEYGKVRFSHASSRWGSCSSTGTISLNIALMKLPFELIDYVIIHELSHTKQMNHSPKFWALVESADPYYKLHRKQLKSHSPTV